MKLGYSRTVLREAAAGAIGALILAGVSLQGAVLAQEDEPLQPLVKVAPVYPVRAAERGLTGYVVVEYTITELGSVENFFVVESTSSLFDRAAVESVAKYKYPPRLSPEPGVRMTIRFEAERSACAPNDPRRMTCVVYTRAASPQAR